MKKRIFAVFISILFLSPTVSWAKNTQKNLVLSDTQIHQAFFKNDLKTLEAWFKQNEKNTKPSKASLLNKAYFLLSQKKYAEAFILFQTLQKDFPSLKRSFSLWLIETAIYSGHFNEAKEEMKKFSEQNPEYLETSFWISSHLLLKCLTEKPELALQEIENKIQTNSSLIYLDIWKACAASSNLRGDHSETLISWFENAKLGLSLEEFFELFKKFSPTLPSKLRYENYFRRWNNLKIQNRNLEAGKEMNDYFLSHTPANEQLSWVAASLYDAKLYAESAYFYEQWIKNQKLNTNQNWEVFDRLGSAYFRSNQFEKAYQSRKELINFSNETQKEKLNYYLGFILFDAGKYSQSIEEFKLFLNAFPKTSLKEESLFKIGFAYIQLKDKENASTYFSELILKYPQSTEAARAAFWLLQNKTASTSALALQKAQTLSFAKNFNTEWKQRYSLKACPIFSNTRNNTNNKILEELSLSFPDTHQKELKNLLELGFFNEFWILYQPYLKSNLSKEEIILWANFISTHTTLPSEIILGLIKQESQFKIQAKSQANAMGLMQLIPQTALQTAKTINLETFQNSDLYQPILNLRLGNQYFHLMLEKFNGNIPQAIAAYNAGPEAVSRWNHKKEETCLEWMEEIPFKETYHYVRKVYQNSWNTGSL